MKLLKNILYKSSISEVVGDTNIEINNITFDSRKVEKNTLFVAIKGTVSDGHDFIQKAVEMGATAIVCEAFPKVLQSKITYVKVNNSSKSLGWMAANIYDNPTAKLTVIGVTGTNGKTTIATLLHALFSKLGNKVGLISTVVNVIGTKEVPSTHTTPDVIQLNQLFSAMVKAGCTLCFMEVSSHAIVQNRIIGIEFKGGVFTNITHDHLDYHKTFTEYLYVKKLFFDNLPTDAFALVNKDDPNAKVILQNTKATKKTYALKQLADYKAIVIENLFSGMHLSIGIHDLWTRLVGRFNAYNLLAVFGVADLLGEESIKVLTLISTLENVNGRFDYIHLDNEITAIVDYAHTPDALENVLLNINEIRTGQESLITVIGCGGDRDKTKRPEMAAIGAELSDKLILTSDNPRSENPEEIIAEMQTGVPGIHFKKTIAITNRKEAIKLACSMAKSGDIILVAGKGHETYQEINGVRHPFDDKKILLETYKMMKN